jgi:lipopolysaccharide transport system ATP-binding protein
MPVIEVDHVTKEYRLGALQGLKQTVLNAGARLIGRQVKAPPLFKALDDMSFSIEQGEVVGIIGHNGAGKSTLLKMLARISTPTSGRVNVTGRIAPLIEVGAGFVADFTGRENVYLNGSILGMSKKDIDRKFDEIVEFAEMAEFIDTPVKRYSSGMQVKLAFAVATSIEAEILIVDEVLAVGDLAFQRKCFDRMEDLIKRKGRSVLLVSHNIRQVERICSRVMLLDHGRLAQDGSPRDVCNRFYDENDQKIAENNRRTTASRDQRLMTSGEIEVVDVRLLDERGQKTEVVTYNSDVCIQLTLRVYKEVEKPVIGIGVHTTDSLYLATSHLPAELVPDRLVPGTHAIRCVVRHFPFLPRTYALRVGISVGKMKDTAFYLENACVFRVQASQVNRTSADLLEGFTALRTEWAIPVETIS